MWRLNVNETGHNTYWVEIAPGMTSIGRAPSNTIALNDTSASRQHAEILWDETKNRVTIHDLNSTNGTFVNHKRISGVVELNDGDNIRIGQAILHLNNEGATQHRVVRGTHFFTREIVLESLDEHAVLIDEVAQKLNTVMDIPSMQREVVALFQRILMPEEVQVVLSHEFASLQVEHALKSIQNRTVEVSATHMYIPITSAREVQGLICLKRPSNASSFSRRDMGLAVAISHQTALTLQRLHLLEKNRQQEQMRELLQRFVSPLEVEYLLKDYLATGKLPELVESKVTILFSDIANSTGIAERMGAQRFAALLTRYYHDTTETIFRFGGIIKYLGDGVMAAFVSTGVDTVVPQEIRAVHAGIRILSRLKRSDYVFEGEPLVMGIAINTGPAMVGYIGVGARTEFNVLGDTVNTASRMEAFARPNRLLVGQETMKAIEGKIPTQPIGMIDVRGRSAPIQMYEVLSTQ